MKTAKSKSRTSKVKKAKSKPPVKSKSPASSRLDKLEKELKRVEKEEKALEKRLTELEEKELSLAKTVGELTQVKKRRPDFLINYVSSKKMGLMAEVKTGFDVGLEKMKTKKVEEAIKDASHSHTPKRDEKVVEVDRKHLLKAQIEDVLKKQELRKQEEYKRQEIIESKTPIKALRMNQRLSDASHLFKALLSKGVLTVDDASRLLKVDREVVKKWAKDLEASGIIEINKPLYGSPKLKLKRLSEGMKKTLIK